MLKIPINKIIPSVDYKHWFKSLDTISLESIYQNLMKVPKV